MTSSAATAPRAIASAPRAPLATPLAAPPVRRRGALLLAGLTVSAVLALLAATLNPFAAIFPLFVVLLAWGLPRLPTYVPLTGVLALAMLADLTSGAQQYAFPPAEGLQLLLLANLNKLTGIEALRFSGVELLLVCVLFVVGLRALSGERSDAHRRVPTASPMLVALVLSFVATVALEVWGIARGGDFRQSLWQFRTVLWMPLIAWLFSCTLRTGRDFRMVALAFTGVACFKVLVGAVFLFLVARPLGWEVQFVTSHFDTVLFVLVFACVVADAYYRPCLSRVFWAAAIGGWMLFGMVINNRRTAWVTLIATLVLFFALLPRPTKRHLVKRLLLFSPLLVAYVMAGRYQSRGIFAPAAQVWSVTKQEDGSSITRDIENFNLLTTLRTSPILGRGWGHEYIEVVKADDISYAFAQYRYVAHNSVLWLWSIGGLVGFTLLWMPLAVSTFFAARAYHMARSPSERVGAFASLATIVAFIVQAWADMGTQSWTTQVLLACAMIGGAKLAHATGAWPPGGHLVGLGVPREGSA